MRKHIIATKNDVAWMFFTGLGLGLATVGFIRLFRNRLTLREAMVLLQQEDNAGVPAYTKSLNRLADKLGMEDAAELRERWHRTRKPLSHSVSAGK
jgi:hypothetical protein